MSVSHLHHFTMVKTSSNSTIPPFFRLPGLFDVFLLHIILNWVTIIREFFSRSQSFLQSQLFLGISKVQAEKKNSASELSSRSFCFNNEKGDDGSLFREDVEMVMGRLGISCNPEGEKLQERLGSNDLSNLFEDKEPSFEEVKEAFYVFDENRDGFIDARELQRVLRMLGREGSELGECKRMIKAFDENGDGRIDFNEFVKFMENNFH